MNYSDSIDFIMSQLPMYQRNGAAAYQADLVRTIDLLKILNNPERKFRCIHVAGTNGKGSVSHLFASIFHEAGYKTGLFTSPHLNDFRERVLVDGNKIPKIFVSNFIDKHSDFLQKNKLSFFEMSVGLAFDFFAKQNVDIAIVEVGMGGRLDSTNVITPDLSVITNISLDHTMFLGDTIEKIAGEKAGIIKNNVPVVIGETQKETTDVFKSIAAKNNAPILFADKFCTLESISHEHLPPKFKVKIYNDDFSYVLNCPLAGDYQMKNLKTVLTAVSCLKKQGYQLSRNTVIAGVKNLQRNFKLRGRWQHLFFKRNIILDTGHNFAGITFVSSMLKSLNDNELHVVLGMVNDKDHAKILSLLPKNATYYFCKPSVPRGFDADELMKIAVKNGLKGRSFPTVKKAILAAIDSTNVKNVIFVGGSTFTVADALAFIEK